MNKSKKAIELTDAEKWRFSQAFEQLLEPETIEQFVKKWKKDKDEALASLGLDSKDTDKLSEYLKGFPFPKERFWPLIYESA